MDLTEGGIRVPWIAHWPGIAPGGASEQLCMTMDWSATMLDVAGVAAHPITRWTASRCCRVLHDAAAQFPRPLHWRMNHRGQRALRDGDWKYLRWTARLPVQPPRPTNASAPTWARMSPSNWPHACGVGGLEGHHAADP
jgi:arylsulfatase A-like enzyme